MLPLALLAAAGGTTALASASPAWAAGFDLYLIVVVYHAVSGSRVAALFTGTAAGLLQDVLASQVLGFHAFVKTGVAFVVGTLGARFMLNHPFPQLLALLLATLLDAGIGALLALAAGLPPAASPRDLVWRAGLTPLLGFIVFRIVEGGRRDARGGRRLAGRS